MADAIDFSRGLGMARKRWDDTQTVERVGMQGWESENT